MQKQSQHLAKERRSKIQLYYDIISAIVEDSQNNDNVSQLVYNSNVTLPMINWPNT